MAASPTIGSIGPFDESQEDWISYSERVEQFFAANDIPDGKKVPTLLSVIGGKTYSLLRNLTSPDKPSAKSYDDLVTILTTHLAPKPLVIAERFRFHKRDQKRGESISEYVAELKRLSQNCSFENALNDSIRDRLVCGLTSESIQRKLLSEANLTLQKATEIATAMEAAAKDATELQGKAKEAESQSVHKLRAKKQYSKCCHCGRTNHQSFECFHKNAICRKCHKVGHIKDICKPPESQSHTSQKPAYKPKPQRNSRKGKPHYKGVHYTELDDSDTPLASIQCESSAAVHQLSQAFWVFPKLDGSTLQMEYDTGSAVAVISEELYNDRFRGHTKLVESPLTLKPWVGNKVTPVGQFSVTVNFKGKEKVLPMHVSPGGGPPLFGREWIYAFGVTPGDLHALKVEPQKGPSATTNMKLQALLDEYQDVFNDKEIGTYRAGKARLHLKEGARPVFCKARPVAYALRPKIEAELERLESTGVIKRVDYSEWATPIVPVVKKDGSVRLCGDFKVTLNPVLEVDKYPTPKVEDVFATLAGGQCYSKIDLKSAYLQMEMDDESKKLLTISTHKGLFQYQKMPFGVASAPAIWQKTMDQVLQNTPRTQCIMDDMIITGSDDDDHLENARKVLQRLRENGLKANRDKCEFFKEEVEYHGHTVSLQGLKKSQSKIEAVLSAPTPTDVGQLRSFVGLVNYYHKFLPNLSTELQPLYRLLQKDVKWSWSDDCEQAFLRVKQLVSSDQVLTHYDPTLPMRVATDASPYGIGAVLSHVLPNGDERPVVFASRSLQASEKNYSQIDKEALAIVFGIRKFHEYLYGHKFTLITDHKPLTSIFHPRKGIPVTTATRLQHWAILLSGYDYEIEYRDSKRHSNADCLSRLPLKVVEEGMEDVADMFSMIQMESLPVTSTDVRRETRRDPVLSKVLRASQDGWTDYAQDPLLRQYYTRRNELTICRDCVMWGNRVCIPDKLQKDVLKELHDSHLGVVKMKSLARSYIYWPGIDRCIEDMARGCASCQVQLNTPSLAPLHPWEWPDQPWKRIHVDYAGPFQGHMYLVVVDAYSKWPEVIPVKSTTSEATIEVLRVLFGRYGLPLQLVSDNGPQFVSAEFTSFLERNGVKHLTSAPYHAATNGQAERFVQTFKSALKSAKNEHGSVQTKLSKFLLKYRTALNSTTGESPAKLFMGRQLRTRLDLIVPDLKQDVINKQTDQVQSRKASAMPNFDIGESVLIRDYRGDDKWMTGVVKSKHGQMTYRVSTNKGVHKRHVEQMRGTNVTHVPKEVPIPDVYIPETTPVPTVHVPEVAPAPAPATGGTTVPKDNKGTSPTKVTSPTKTPRPVKQTETVVKDSVPATNVTRSGRVIKKPSRFQD